MGNCLSQKQPLDQRARDTDKRLSRRLANEHKQLRDLKKMLLLGTGDSGKSTFLKQCHLLYGDGEFGDLEEQRTTISVNLLTCMIALIHGSEQLSIAISTEANKLKAQALRQMSDFTSDEHLRSEHPDFFKDLQSLWDDPGIQEVFTRAHEVSVPTSTEYYFKDLQRIAAEDYTPTTQDILRSRTKTTGISETNYKYKNMPFTIVDIGGQRSERRKWVHVFDGVDVLLFFVASSEYDQRLEEDSRVNRMHESLRLFTELINSRWFYSMPIVLLLNKIDVLEEKIQHRDLTIAFPEYTGGNNFESAAVFIAGQFSNCNKNAARPITIHRTCATDTKLMKTIFTSIMESILMDNLANASF